MTSSEANSSEGGEDVAQAHERAEEFNESLLLLFRLDDAAGREFAAQVVDDGVNLLAQDLLPSDDPSDFLRSMQRYRRPRGCPRPRHN